MKIQASKVKTLYVFAHPRYWEDTYINGVPDTEDGANVPCVKAGVWCPIIDFQTGRITNWKQGVTADVHYKVCDQGTYKLCDENNHLIAEIQDDYVPRCMCPEEDGFGDYIIMKITADGQIENWNPTVERF